MFYDNLQLICKKNNTSPTAIVKLLKLSTGNVTNWKNGVSPNGDILVQLSELLNVSCDYLLTGKDSGSDLTEAEIKLLEKYSKLSDGERQEVIGYINCLLAHHIEAAGSETA